MSDRNPTENSPNEEQPRSPLKLLIWILVVPIAMLILSALRD